MGMLNDVAPLVEPIVYLIIHSKTFQNYYYAVTVAASLDT